MPLESLTANRIGVSGNSLEPQRQSTGLLFITGLRDTEIVELSIQSFGIPKQNSNPIELYYLNETRKFAGRTVYEDIQCIFNDYVTRSILTELMFWRSLVIDPVTGKQGLKSNYAKQARAVLYAPDGTNEREWAVESIWPSAVDPGDIDHSADDFVRVNVTFTIDKAVFKPAIPNYRG